MRQYLPLEAPQIELLFRSCRPRTEAAQRVVKFWSGEICMAGSSSRRSGTSFCPRRMQRRLTNQTMANGTEFMYKFARVSHIYPLLLPWEKRLRPIHWGELEQSRAWKGIWMKGSQGSNSLSNEKYVLIFSTYFSKGELQNWGVQNTFHFEKTFWKQHFSRDLPNQTIFIGKLAIESMHQEYTFTGRSYWEVERFMDLGPPAVKSKNDLANRSGAPACGGQQLSLVG